MNTLVRGCAVMALLGFLSGCGYEDYGGSVENSDSAVPFCTVIEAPSAERISPPTAALRWTFDSGWKDGVVEAELTPSQNLNASDLDSSLRINGGGHSLKLDGHQYATFKGTKTDAPFSGQFTLSAWISLAVPEVGSERNALGPPIAAKENTTWPILSTRGATNQCGGYELSLRRRAKNPVPVLVFGYDTMSASNECTEHEVKCALQPWALRDGHWHHVAASYLRSRDSASLALFWDTSMVAQDNPLAPRAAEGIPVSPPVLYVGANGRSSQSATETKFTGNIDELAVFNEALTTDDLMAHVTDSTTREGPGYTISIMQPDGTTLSMEKSGPLPWRAMESRDWAADNTSKTVWIDNSPKVLNLSVSDEQWGQGSVEAQIWPPISLVPFDTLTLNASVPLGKAFQVSIGGPDGYCTWIQDKSDVSARYTVNLRQPVNCLSWKCDFGLSSVSRISIGTEWVIPNGAERVEGDVQLRVSGITLNRNANTLPEPRAYGGARGPRGWCWRQQLFEPGGWVRVDEADSLHVSATLSGAAGSVTRLVAAFESQWLDLSGCSGVVIDADVADFLPGAKDRHAFVIQDAWGSWRSYQLGANPVEVASPNNSSEVGFPDRDPNFSNFPEELDLKRIRYLGIQKPWSYPGEAAVTIRDIRFLGGQDCQPSQ